MTLQPSAIRPSLPRPPGWVRRGLAVLLTLLLISASQSVAAVTLDTDRPLPAASTLATSDDHGPSCHHGHAPRPDTGALLRVERQDLEFEALSSLVASTDTAPHVVTVSGLPQARPDPSPVPVYLLTRRLRS